MCKKEDFISCCQYGWHKGFYTHKDMITALSQICYENLFEEPCNCELPCDSLYLLLCGACNYFAVSLQRKMGYNVYIIEGNNNTSFHAFCQVYKNGRWHYIDARGVTTSFDEFMTVASEFVSDEYTIRMATPNDIEDWEEDCDYNKEAYAFAEAVIDKYEQHYTV